MRVLSWLISTVAWVQDERAMWVNTFGFGCLIVDMVEMGFWKIDEAHSVINKCESPSCPFCPFPRPHSVLRPVALADFIQLWYFLPYTYGKPGPNREHKVVARHFLAEVMEAFMAIPRDIFKRLTDHGKGHDGKGFDETNVSFPSQLFASAFRCCFHYRFTQSTQPLLDLDTGGEGDRAAARRAAALQAAQRRGHLALGRQPLQELPRGVPHADRQEGCKSAIF